MLFKYMMLQMFLNGMHHPRTPNGLLEPPVAVVGGNSIPITEAPYMASLRMNGRHVCGASIISEDYLVTAAQCVIGDMQYEVLVGSDQVTNGGFIYDVETFIVHESYTGVDGDYDISLVKLATPLTFSDKVAAIFLANTGVDIETGTTLNVTGWGVTEVDRNSISTSLQRSFVPVVDFKVCQTRYRRFLQNITPRMICAGEPGHDSCMGDSGGPLTYNNYLVGVTAFGVGCGTPYPGVYTKITAMLPWIRSKINI